jgi:hypothetical protein
MRKILSFLINTTVSVLNTKLGENSLKNGSTILTNLFEVL